MFPFDDIIMYFHFQVSSVNDAPSLMLTDLLTSKLNLRYGAEERERGVAVSKLVEEFCSDPDDDDELGIYVSCALASSQGEFAWPHLIF